MKTLKTFIVAIAIAMIAIMPVCIDSAEAGGRPWGNNCNSESLVGLEISGGSSVGAQLYGGNTTVTTNLTNCFGTNNIVTQQGFVGASLMTSANGSICLTNTGSDTGDVTGIGSFNSRIDGSIHGVDFYTESSVMVTPGVCQYIDY